MASVRTAEGYGVTRRGSLIAVVVSSACFGTLAILLSKAYQYGAQPLPLLAWRFALTSVLMAVYQLVRDPRSLAVSRGDLGRFAVLALSGYGAASLCFFYAMKHASAPVVAVLLYTYPAMVAVASAVFLHERFTIRRAGALALTFAGCALVLRLFSAGASTSTPGILLGLGAAAGYTVFNLLSYRWMERVPRLVMMTYMFGMSSVALAFVALAGGQSLSPAGWSMRLWACLALIVLVPTFIAVVLYLGGMRGLGASQAAIVSTFEPLFTIALAWFVLDQRLDVGQWVGALLVLAGVVLAEWHTAGVSVDEAAAV
jgi:drug/metabolite transporter (DMT)-like permease